MDVQQNASPRKSVFISYAHLDNREDFVSRLGYALDMYMDTFWDIKLQAGAWDKQLIRKIEECDALLVVMSHIQKEESEPCKRELQVALDSGKPIVPIRRFDNHHDVELEKLQYADFTGSFDEGFKHLTYLVSGERLPSWEYLDTQDDNQLGDYPLITGTRRASSRDTYRKGLIPFDTMAWITTIRLKRIYEERFVDYTRLGSTGMQVSRICLGCMGFGDAEHWVHKWVLDEENSRPIIQKALELGINFFDTANVYSIGVSEEILGRALKNFAKRDEVVIATKVHGKMRDDPNGSGLSRKAIISEIDKSLKRLETDYVDLYQIHRWDYETPIEETMEALNDVVRAGKARYIGASAMWAWQFQKALHVAEKHGWTRFVSMQDHLNLIYREEEREMLPLCREEKIGVIPYSPLASGRLTRDWSAETTLRSETDQIAKTKYDATAETDQQVVERVAELAEKYGVPRVHIALAWLLQKEPVTAPIIGATKITHLEDAVGALSVQLTQEDVAYLEEPYVPHRIVGHQ